MRRSDSEAIEAAIEEDPEEAVRLCEALLEEVEDDADIWAYLAESELAAGRGDDALEALAQVVELDPEWIEALTLRAEILIDQGKLGAAAIELDVAIELDADDARVLRARALMLEVGGDGKGADKVYAEAEAADSLWPRPPRLDRSQIVRALAKTLDIDAGAISVQEMPSEGARLRMADLPDPESLVVFARNVERELDEGATIEDFVMLVEETLEARVPG